MSKNLVDGNPNLCFWEQNPELQYLTPFAELIKEEGKEYSSKIMWALYMVEDPNSKLFRMPKAERIKEVEANYLEGKKIDWKKHHKLIAQYGKLCMSPTKRMYKTWVEKYDELTAYIETLKFGRDDEALLKVFTQASKIWSQLTIVEKALQEEEAKEETLQGGDKLSTRERRRRRHG